MYSSSSFLIALCVLFALHSSTTARVTSFGKKTAQGFRNEFLDRNFTLRYDDAEVVQGPGFRAQLGTVKVFPILGSPDIQYAMSRVRVQPGHVFPSHTHPRAAETQVLLKGKIRTKVRFEGFQVVRPRVVTNIVYPMEISLFPQGLAHETTCISKTPCEFIAFLTSADPGVTIAPPFDK